MKNAKPVPILRFDSPSLYFWNDGDQFVFVSGMMSGSVEEDQFRVKLAQLVGEGNAPKVGVENYRGKCYLGHELIQNEHDRHVSTDEDDECSVCHTENSRIVRRCSKDECQGVYTRFRACENCQNFFDNCTDTKKIVPEKVELKGMLTTTSIDQLKNKLEEFKSREQTTNERIQENVKGKEERHEENDGKYMGKCQRGHQVSEDAPRPAVCDVCRGDTCRWRCTSMCNYDVCHSCQQEYKDREKKIAKQKSTMQNIKNLGNDACFLTTKNFREGMESAQPGGKTKKIVSADTVYEAQNDSYDRVGSLSTESKSSEEDRSVTKLFVMCRDGDVIGIHKMMSLETPKEISDRLEQESELEQKTNQNIENLYQKYPELVVSDEKNGERRLKTKLEAFHEALALLALADNGDGTYQREDEGEVDKKVDETVDDSQKEKEKKERNEQKQRNEKIDLLETHTSEIKEQTDLLEIHTSKIMEERKKRDESSKKATEDVMKWVNTPLKSVDVSPFWIACSKGKDKVIKLLLDQCKTKRQDKSAEVEGFDKKIISINQARSEDNATPLFIACQNGYTKIVKLLINGFHSNDSRDEDRINVDVETKDNVTPYNIAYSAQGTLTTRNLAIAKLIFKYSPTEAERNKECKTQIFLGPHRKNTKKKDIQRESVQDFMEDVTLLENSTVKRLNLRQAEIWKQPGTDESVIFEQLEAILKLCLSFPLLEVVEFPQAKTWNGNTDLYTALHNDEDNGFFLYLAREMFLEPLGKWLGGTWAKTKTDRRVKQMSLPLWGLTDDQVSLACSLTQKAALETCAQCSHFAVVLFIFLFVLRFVLLDLIFFQPLVFPPSS